MEDDFEYPALMDYLTERGKAGRIPLREHLEILKTYADGLYEINAQEALQHLEAHDLDQAPLEIDQEDSPDSVAYYLPDHHLVRILPDYPFEVQEWIEVGDEDEEDLAGLDG